MSLFDLISDDQDAERLQKMSKSLHGPSVKGAKKKDPGMSALLDEMSNDVGFLALLTMSIFKELVDKGIITRSQIVQHIIKLDEIDGVKDGKLDMKVMKGHLGFAAPAEKKAEPAKKPSKARRVRRTR